MKLKFKLVKFDRTLIFEVLEQDPRFMANKEVEFYSYDKSKLGIRSGSYIPSLLETESAVYLKGFSNMSTDNLIPVARASFPTNEARDLYYDQMLDSLVDWANNAPEFQEKKEVIQKDNVYTFGDLLTIEMAVIGNKVVYSVTHLDPNVKLSDLRLSAISNSVNCLSKLSAEDSLLINISHFFSFYKNYKSELLSVSKLIKHENDVFEV